MTNIYFILILPLLRLFSVSKVMNTFSGIISWLSLKFVSNSGERIQVLLVICKKRLKVTPLGANSNMRVKLGVV
jgi:hypothetical protein